MLAKIAPKFVVSRVIQNAYYADYMAVELAKEIFSPQPDYFYKTDPKKFFECNFYGYISSLPAPTEFANQFEKQKYLEAVETFKNYNEVRALTEKLAEFVVELRELYKVTETSNTSHNLFARPIETDPLFQSDLLDAIERYMKFLEALEPYPEWKDKVVEEIGKWFHMIHNNLAESDAKQHLFLKLNRQDYFI